ncbi:MAG: type III-B CRISPR-associated protein Cas10/Cmr2, partial [Candidatus Hydrothermia bacterium]
MNWKLKLKAILHDPPYKMLAFQGPSQLVQNIKLQKAPHIGYNLKSKDDPEHHYLHEIWAEELLNYIFANECIKDNNVELADQLASAQSRIIVKPQLQNEQDFNKDSQVNYNESYFIDIFSERKEPIQTPDEVKVQDLFNRLGGLFPPSSDEEAKFIFLFLWRFYPEIFPQINKHPADSRAPNHSIYDHLVQTSAIVLALPNPAFLLFTIGPVQSFISKARKTSDLWSGSYMLSYLIWESMKILVEDEELGPDVIIFPNLFGQPLVDRWLYFEIFKNSPFANFNEPRFKE